ncbi:outer-membrane receptor for ferric coprogen and ferric-rhodotorulic acid [Sphingopyxis sp. YR583]|nr:outer-membrane receptor for ferric coprogen and ferric-rhodotorulic acid [Sphingopyxis sp. YR583]
MNMTKAKHFRFAAALLGGTSLSLMVAPAAFAQSEQVRSYNVPAQSLTSAAAQLSEQGGMQLVVDSAVGAGVRSSAVSGRMNGTEALGRMLAGTGLTWRSVGNNTIAIERPADASDGDRVLDVVRIDGSQGGAGFGRQGQAVGVNGVNGSRDITATEGTGSFTSGALTVGSKTPQAIKDVPQSISLLTDEMLEQRNVTDLTSAMRQLPGITLEQGATSLDYTFYSRGFRVSNIQIDGGAPISTESGLAPIIDMAMYDHVELLRGAGAQFGGYGDPSGTINLVRKKPLDHPQFTVEAQAGSWSNYRIVADATSPLALDGRLRGRLVMTYQTNKFFYDTAKDNKTLVYGIAEFDLTPSTLLTGGFSHTRQASVPWRGGLPRYLTGGDLELPRSICLCFDWNRTNIETTEVFAGMEQRLGGDWTLKADLTYTRQSNDTKVGFSSGAVNPNNLRGARLQAYQQDFSSEALAAQLGLQGSFELFGQRQEIALGISRSRSDGGNSFDYGDPLASSPSAPYQPYPGGPLYFLGSPNGSRPQIDVFAFDPNDLIFSEPRDALPIQYQRTNISTTTTAYFNLRLTPIERLHFSTGIRWSRSSFASESDVLCTSIPATDPGVTPSCFGLAIGDALSTAAIKHGQNDFSWPPAISLSYDLTKSVTAYLGYTDIYRSQSNYLAADLKPLEPIRGSNWEGGVKWAARDGKLNVTLSAYRMTQKGFSLPDPPDGSGVREISPGILCCYVQNPENTYRSRGFDLEVAGEVFKGLQVAASYNYNSNKAVGAIYGDDSGRPFSSAQPKNVYKLWMSYDFGAGGAEGFLSGFSSSIGINGQSSGFYEGEVCVNFAPGSIPSPLSGAQPCNSFEEPDYVSFKYVVPPHAVVSARIDYRFSDKWSATLNLENIFDKTYYQTVAATPTSGHWYGAPRSFAATVRGKF